MTRESKDERKRCLASVFDGFRSHPCSRYAKPGTDKCGVHSDTAQARRNEKSERAARVHSLRYERDDAVDGIVLAARMADPATLPDALREAVAKYHAALNAYEEARDDRE